jgi:hypothetical protein
VESAIFMHGPRKIEWLCSLAWVGHAYSIKGVRVAISTYLRAGY